MSATASPHFASAENLLALLEQERQALQGGDFERLMQLCREKAQALQQLGGLLAALRGASFLVDNNLELHYTYYFKTNF